MTLQLPTIRWRSTGAYTPNNASKTGLIEETRLFLQAYTRQGDPRAARQTLVDGELPQRSRATRKTIGRIILDRLTRWSPPEWVLQDLAQFASEPDSAVLKAALLLHVPRQDHVLYDLVQQVIVPHWQNGERDIIRADVQRFLDEAASAHPEVETWSHETREKLAGNLLTILRDYGLLQGTAKKHIVQPVVPAAVVQHLARLLHEEGLTPSELAHHPDWQLLLWDAPRVHEALAVVGAREATL